MSVKIDSPASESQIPDARSKLRAMWRGSLRRCPSCGRGTLFSGYLKVAGSCDHCGEQLHHQRADDAPAYFTITIVAHIIIPLVVVAELAWRWPYWLHAVMWFPATLALTFWLMPRVKGAIIGQQWALAMHGFGGSGDGGDSQYIERPEQ